MNMLALLRTWGTVLRRSWPELLAAYFVAAVAHRLLIQLSAWVYSYSDLLAYFVEPLAILARLIGYVAMILIVRDSLPTLSALAPTTFATSADRRRAFVNSILVSILPFFAFYYAAGFLKEDHFDVVRAGTQMSVDRSIIEQLAGKETVVPQALTDQVGWLSVSMAVLAFALRSVLKRFADRLPRWFSVVSVYLEVVWVFMFVAVVETVRKGAVAWMEGRKGLAWFFDIGDWFAANLPVVASAWEALVGVIGTTVSLVSVPLAWLTTVGVVYGQKLSAQPVKISARAFELARRRYSSVNQTVREGVNFAVDKVAGEAKGRLSLIYKAFTLMFRAGPVLFAGYVLIYHLWTLGFSWLQFAIPRLFGPMDVDDAQAVATFATAFVVVVTEPLRIALIGAAYDSALGRTFDRSILKAERSQDKAATELPSGAPVSPPDRGVT